MNKNNKLIIKNLIFSVGFFISIFFLIEESFYKDFIQNPDTSSPSTGGKLISLFLYFLDKFLGRIGVNLLLLGLALLFLWRAYVAYRLRKK